MLNEQWILCEAAARARHADISLFYELVHSHYPIAIEVRYIIGDRQKQGYCNLWSTR